VRAAALLLVAGLAVLGVLAGCASGPGTDALSDVRWSEHVRDCAVEHGGSGLGTRVDSVVKGDVNSDGRVDTLVVDECEPKTTAWPQVVEIFDGASDSGRPSLLGRLLEGDQDYPRQLGVTVEPGGRVVVTGVGLSANAPQCCPDLALRKVFTFANGHFTLTEHTATPR
jgi:hypothetical protein